MENGTDSPERRGFELDHVDLYRALAENASDLITVLSPDGTILYESPSLTRLLGYRPEELVGRNAFELIHPDDREEVRETWTAGLDDPENVGLSRYRCLHADGSWRHLESSGRRPPGDARLPGILVHTRDVTDRKELEERLQEARKMEAVGRLVSGIAHDFNNLLTVIKCDIDLLLDDTDEADPRRMELEEIREASTRASALTRDLLAFGRQEMLRTQDIDLVRAIQSMLPEVERTVGEGVKVDFCSDPGPALVRVDPVFARQVMLELVHNARDSMSGAGRLRIELQRLRVDPESPPPAGNVGPGRWIAVAYADSGDGMEPEVRDRAFEPFFSTREGRSGLGLSTVWGLVKQSGGEVWIESESGEGTTVWTYLPEVGDQPGP